MCEVDDKKAFVKDGTAEKALEKSNADEQKHIYEEIEKYEDIVLVPMIDSYRTLAKKLKLSYKWGLQHTSAKWFLKSDEDFYIQMNQITELTEKLQPAKAVIGRIARGWGVHKGGKWAEFNYKPKRYPPFPVGSSGHIVSRDVAEFIVKVDGFEYQGEDVSVGIWLFEHPDFRAHFYDSKRLTSSGECMNRQFVIVGHDVKIQTMKACHKSRSTSRL